MKKFIVIGLGSMGKRRIRLIKDYMNYDIIGVDSDQMRCTEVSELYQLPCYTSIKDVLRDNDIFAAIVSTSPLTHYKIIKELLLSNIHVFSEINLTSHGYGELISLAQQHNLILFLSSTQLYRKEVIYTQSLIPNPSNLNYTYHVGQYLPDWHPWETYKNFFVSKKETNACKEILAIELPWLISTFGDVLNFKIVKKKSTCLELDYNDTYLIIMEHQNNNHGVFIVDIVCRDAIQSFRLFGENILLEWNGTPDEYYEFDFNTGHMKKHIFNGTVIKDAHYSSNIIENDYLEELKAFEDKICYPTHKYYDFQDNLKTLDLIDKMEESN